MAGLTAATARRCMVILNRLHAIHCNCCCATHLPNLLCLPPQADWNIVKRGWYAHVLGEAPHTFTDTLDAVKTLRVRCF